ncbi:MAG: Calx-beta domain-containing protein [Dokdonella sp.]
MAMIWKHVRNRRRDFATLFVLLWVAQAGAQELVYSTGSEIGGPSGLVVIPNLAGGLAASSPIYIDPLGGAPINPHGFALIAPMTAVTGQISVGTGLAHRLNVIDIETASISYSFQPGGANNTDYTGYGTVISNPARTHLLLAPGDFQGTAGSLLWVVPMPLSALSVASDILTMPGKFGPGQTHAIAFDPNTGRAYVAHTNGVTVIDPPYHAANIAFTIPLPAVADPSDFASRSVALSRDAATMLLTSGGATPGTTLVTVIHAPFSATSPSEQLNVAQASQLHAIAFTPDGSQALAVDAVASGGQGQVFAISAPYTSTSHVEWLHLPAGGQNTGGFGDIEISPDGRMAALAGGCIGDGCPLVTLRAPFTEAGFGIETMNVPRLPYPYYSPGRGTGTVHFWPTPVVPRPQIRLDRIAVTEGNSGTRPARFTISLSNPSTQTISINYATASLQAVPPSDYIQTVSTLSFAPGETRKTVDVPVVGDTVIESDEYFSLNLSNPVNASLFSMPSAGDGYCLIVNDDGGTPYIATDPPLPDAYVGVPYTQTFTAQNTAAAPTWAVAAPNLNLVGGLGMAGASGVLSGVPVQAGSYYFAVYLSGLNVSREYHLNVLLDRIFADGFEAVP